MIPEPQGLIVSSKRCWRRQLDPPDLEKFVQWNDNNLYNKDIGRVYLTDKAQVRLFNPSSSLEELHSALKTLNLADEQRLRPTWDQYFMQLASLAAQRSNCMKRRVGCVLVRESRVISTGYNGTPRHLQNCNQGGCTILTRANQCKRYSCSLADSIKYRPTMQSRRRRRSRPFNLPLPSRGRECLVGSRSRADSRRSNPLL
jgi:hypothetical protein